MVRRERKTIDIDSKLEEFYKMLTLEEKEVLTKNLTVHTYKKNEVFYHEGERPDQMFFMLTGKGKIFKEGVGGRNQTMRMIKPVEYFGYRAYLSGQDFITAAAAIENSVIAKCPLSILIPMMQENSRLAWFFVQRLAGALGSADERCVALTQKHIRARLADTLLLLKKNYGLEEDGATLSIYLSREDLANLSNMTTANAIRILSAFAQEKLVIIDGRKIKIIEEAELTRISEMG